MPVDVTVMERIKESCMSSCQVEGCGRKVSKSGHTFCLEHWKAERSGTLRRCITCGRWHDGACDISPNGDEDAPAGMLSSTKIGKHFGLSNVRVNLIMAEV